MRGYILCVCWFIIAESKSIKCKNTKSLLAETAIAPIGCKLPRTLIPLLMDPVKADSFSGAAVNGFETFAINSVAAIGELHVFLPIENI